MKRKKGNGKTRKMTLIVHEQDCDGVVVKWRCITLTGPTTESLEEQLNALDKTYKRDGSNSNKIVPYPFHVQLS